MARLPVRRAALVADRHLDQDEPLHEALRRELTFAVHQPAYGIPVERSSERGILRITFEDAAGNPVATFPAP